MLLERIKELTKAREDFSFETTLAGRGYARVLNEMRQSGYRVLLLFLWLPSADQAVVRVANRVRQGGHAVPEVDVRRRWTSGLRNLFRIYRPCFDAWWIFDASHLPPALIARGDGGNVTAIQPDLFDQIQRHIEE